MRAEAREAAGRARRRRVTLGGAARGRAKSNEILVPLDPGACSPQKWRGTPGRVPGGAAATPARAPLAPLPAFSEALPENFFEEGSPAPEAAAFDERFAAANGPKGLSPPLARRASSGSGASATRVSLSLSQAADKVLPAVEPPDELGSRAPPRPSPRPSAPQRPPPRLPLARPRPGPRACPAAAPQRPRDPAPPRPSAPATQRPSAPAPPRARVPRGGRALRG